MMSSKVALLFPGQGAHDLSMLQGVQECAAFRARYEIVAAALGSDPLDQLARGQSDYLNQNRVSSLLTLLVSSLSLDRFREKLGAAGDLAAGYSVGQWTALYAAGALSFESLVSVVSTRATMMDRCFERTPGAMLAVIGLRAEPLEELCSRLREAGHEVRISNYNCVGQYTLSGTASAIEIAALELVDLKPKKVQRLAVSGAWHSPLLAQAATDFGGYLEEVALGPPAMPVIDNVTGELLPTERGALNLQLARHLDSPVMWEKGVRTMLALGAGRFVEIGYGNVLTKFGFFIDRRVEHQAFHLS